MNGDIVIHTSGLTKRYGDTVGIADLDLAVPAGCVFGYLGPNGAGKSTTIRLLMGLLTPTAGRAEVLGSDTRSEMRSIHQRVGYLPGDFVAYPDLTGEEYLRFLGNLRGGGDASRVTLLAKRLDLDLTARIGGLSHGNRQKIGLLQAFVHDPELLILDEPTQGLDPLMQQEFLALVAEARELGRSVLLSSHILDEVEAVADHVGIVRAGRLVDVKSVGELKLAALRRIELTFEHEPPAEALRRVPQVRQVDVTGRIASVAIDGSTAELLTVAAPHGVVDLAVREPSLEEIFLAYYTAEEGSPR